MATQLSHETAAKDGIKRKPSKIAEVHRPLVLVDPPMEGRDVANLQRATRARLKARGLADDVPTPEHGKFTPATMLACIEAQYFLGLLPETYQTRNIHGHRVVTEGAQLVIRQPDERNADQLERAKEREGQLELGPKFYEKLRAEMGLIGHGVEAALDFAADHVGTRERPAGSNSGPRITDWCRLTGYRDPVPWCGCFVNACLMKGGLPNGKGWIGYTPAILHRAKAGTGGWSFHARGVPGDLALFDDGVGGDPVVHVEIVRKRLSDTRYSTYGGNTSAGNGSPSDGGMVARRDDRSTVGAFRIIGFARPPWRTVS